MQCGACLPGDKHAELSEHGDDDKSDCGWRLRANDRDDDEAHGDDNKSVIGDSGDGDDSTLRLLLAAACRA